MSESKTAPYILVPEASLLESLPEHQKKRFETALKIMHEDLNQGLCWEQVAEKSAISPYHFHRQFTQLFNETPGQYLGRLRLQYAVNLLLDYTSMSITEVAHESGYSSSQALAKALKRKLGITAKAVRQLASSGTPRETAQLLYQLAHPDKEANIEQQLAQQLPCELIWYPNRYFKKRHIPGFEWEEMCEELGEGIKELTFLTPVKELIKPWKDINYIICEWTDNQTQPEHVIPEGHYLCCEVYIVSDVGYAAAVQGLFRHAEKMGYQFNKDGFLIEMVLDVEFTPTGGETFSLQLPIKD